MVYGRRLEQAAWGVGIVSIFVLCVLAGLVYFNQKHHIYTKYEYDWTSIPNLIGAGLTSIWIVCVWGRLSAKPTLFAALAVSFLCGEAAWGFGDTLTDIWKRGLYLVAVGSFSVSICFALGLVALDWEAQQSRKDTAIWWAVGCILAYRNVFQVPARIISMVAPTDNVLDPNLEYRHFWGAIVMVVTAAFGFAEILYVCLSQTQVNRSNGDENEQSSERNGHDSTLLAVLATVAAAAFSAAAQSPTSTIAGIRMNDIGRGRPYLILAFHGVGIILGLPCLWGITRFRKEWANSVPAPGCIACVLLVVTVIVQGLVTSDNIVYLGILTGLASAFTCAFFAGAVYDSCHTQKVHFFVWYALGENLFEFVFDVIFYGTKETWIPALVLVSIGASVGVGYIYVYSNGSTSTRNPMNVVSVTTPLLGGNRPSNSDSANESTSVNGDGSVIGGREGSDGVSVVNPLADVESLRSDTTGDPAREPEREPDAEPKKDKVIAQPKTAPTNSPVKTGDKMRRVTVPQPKHEMQGLQGAQALQALLAHRERAHRPHEVPPARYETGDGESTNSIPSSALP